MDSSHMPFLKSILQFTTQHTSSQDTNEPPKPREISPEVFKFSKCFDLISI